MGGDSGEDEDKLEYMHKIKMKILCDIDYCEQYISVIILNHQKEHEHKIKNDRGGVKMDIVKIYKNQSKNIDNIDY